MMHGEQNVKFCNFRYYLPLINVKRIIYFGSSS